MIEAVTFDFWATLYRDPYDGERSVMRCESWADLLNEKGHPVTVEAILVAFQETTRRFHQLWLGEQQCFPPSEATDYTLNALSIDASAEDRKRLTALLEETVLATPPILVDGVREVLSQIAGRYRLGVVSDTGYSPGRSLRKIMDRDGILEYFQALAFSDETGRSKPQPIQFMTTLNALGVQPERSAHIGDLMGTDILGAKNLGIRAVLFNGVNDKHEDTGLADAVISDMRELPPLLERW
ncbi:MAG: HAD family hydrolase [Armatimonadetes bacterium]|nr:HAD family hydrolase [Armatimonadota bacterium]